MAVNRYDQASPYEYVSQYTPIPFEELVTLGKHYAAERRAAEEQLASNIRTFGKFISPSDVDVANYHKESIGKLAPFVEQVAANPSLMKDAAFRAQIQNAINNIDYTKLGALEQSAKNMQIRLQNIAKMKAEGRYNENWDKVDISNWDTLNDSYGIMNDLTPIEYQTLEEFGTPFADKIKPTFYKGVDPNNPNNKMPHTNWMSITKNDIARQFAQHLPDIKMDPIGREHYNDVARAYLQVHPNATQEELDAVFIDALATRQSDRIISTPVVDQLGLNKAMAKYKYDLEHGEDPTAPNAYITPREQLSNQYQSNFNDYVERNLTDPTRSDYKNDQRLQKSLWNMAKEAARRAEILEAAGAPVDDVNTYKMLAEAHAADASQAQVEVNRKEFSNMYGSDKIGPEDFDNLKKDLDFGKFEKVSKDMVDNMGGQITLTSSYDMLKHVASPTKVIWSGGESDGFKLSSSADFVLPSTLAKSVLKLNGKTPADKSRFVAALESGLYKNVTIIPQPHGTSIFNPQSPSGKTEFVKATAVINLDGIDLDRYHFLEDLPGTAFFLLEDIGHWILGDYAEQDVKAMGGKYNSDTNTAEIEVYVPIGETAQQAEDYNFERNKDRFGTTTNTGDRYGFTYRTSTARLNTNEYGEEK